jgi:hypothetical protein
MKLRSIGELRAALLGGAPEGALEVDCSFPIGARQLASVEPAIKNNPNLVRLSLSGCGLDDDAARVLASALAFSWSLESVDLSHNAISELGAHFLLNAVRNHNCSLRRLELQGEHCRGRTATQHLQAGAGPRRRRRHTVRACCVGNPCCPEGGSTTMDEIAACLAINGSQATDSDPAPSARGSGGQPSVEAVERRRAGGEPSASRRLALSCRSLPASRTASPTACAPTRRRVLVLEALLQEQAAAVDTLGELCSRLSRWHDQQEHAAVATADVLVLLGAELQQLRCAGRRCASRASYLALLAAATRSPARVPSFRQLRTA